MPNSAFPLVLRASLAGTLLVAGVATMGWGHRVAGSVILGGAWNLASFWCLTRMLLAWAGPERSPRRAVRWLLAKLALYASVIALFLLRSVSVPAFGVGFTVSLLAALLAFAMANRRLVGAIRS